MKKKIIRGVLVGLAAFAAAFILSALKVTRPLEWKSWDLRLRLLSHPSRASKDIVLLLIDQYSLDFYDQQGLSWPWPRQIYSALLRYLKSGGAKAVFFDLVFTENSVYGLDDDEQFREAIAEAGNVFLPISLSQKESEKDEPEEQAKAQAALLSPFALKTQGISPRGLFPARTASLPIETLLGAAQGLGNVLFTPDDDSIFRRLPLFFSYHGLILPSMPLAIARYVKGDQVIPSIRLEESGQMLIRYHGPMGTYRAFPAATIINSWALIEEGKKPQISPSEFAGKIVLIGGSAPGIKDLRPSPFNPDCPGVEIHAAALDTLIQGDFMRPSSGFVLYALGLIFAIITGIATSVQRKIWRIVLFFLICLALPAASSILAFLSGYWLEFVAPELAVVFSFIGASLINYSVEGKQRRFIKNIFRFYLSPDVIERMLKNPGLLKLGGEKREVSSFFSDVAGFTSISEGLSPEELVNLLNSYLSEMTNIILSSGGTLDKYEGDAIIAFWNAPLDQPDHALRACRAAMHCQRRLEEVRSDFQSRFGHEIRMRIGVNSGPAVVGNMGSAKRFDYTAMGDTINLASRLEGACKQYGVPILIGELTYEKVKDEIFCREVDLIRVIGKKKPVRVFEAIAERSELSPAEEERIKSFHSGLEAYRHQDWAKALSVFQSLPDDRLVQTYITRISNFQSSSPPESWDGVYELKHK